MVSKIPLSELEQFPFFSGIPHSQLEGLANAITQRTRPPRSGVYYPGDSADHVFFVVRGRVKVGCTSPDNREVIHEIVLPGDMFGELALLGETERKDFAIPMKMEATLVAIRAVELRSVIERVPQLADRFINHLGIRVRNTERMIEDYVLFDSKDRIIKFILSLDAAAVGDKAARDGKAYHYMTHQDIAGLTGASRQFVTSVMNDLRKQKLIDFNRVSVQVKDRKGLENLL